MGITDSDGILGTLKDIEVYNLRTDIDKILVGDVIGLKVNTNYDETNPEVYDRIAHSFHINSIIEA